jgi:signal transduction histidine kinase
VRSAAWHVLDVLVTNALDHGAGRVTVAAAPRLAVGWPDVGDEGAGFADREAAFARRGSGAVGHGIGLALARSLIEVEGGRLIVARTGPAPEVRIVVPARA